MIVMRSLSRPIQPARDARSGFGAGRGSFPRRRRPPIHRLTSRSTVNSPFSFWKTSVLRGQESSFRALMESFSMSFWSKVIAALAKVESRRPRSSVASRSEGKPTTPKQRCKQVEGKADDPEVTLQAGQRESPRPRSNVASRAEESSRPRSNAASSSEGKLTTPKQRCRQVGGKPTTPKQRCKQVEGKANDPKATLLACQKESQRP
jgi:hypothetical protein